MGDRSYRRILVIGGVGVGKTSILATAISGSFSENYAPTTHVEEFYAVDYGLRFIDTPGVNKIAISDRKFESFILDPQVSEYTMGYQHDENNSILKNIDLDTIAAFMIVYAESRESLNMAEALRLCIRSNPNMKDKLIYMVQNRGDDKHVKIGDDSISKKNAQVFRDRPNDDWFLVTDSFTHWVQVCAVNSFMLQDLCLQLSRELSTSVANTAGRKLAGRKILKRSCTKDNGCMIS